MSGPIFVLDAEGRPLMPMSPAHARYLLKKKKAQRVYHHAFTVIQLTRAVPNPQLRPVFAAIVIHRATAQMWLMTDASQGPILLLALTIDLRNDITHRLRRRAAHRRRRRYRQRYHQPPQHGIPFKARRPSMRNSRWGWRHLRKKGQRAHGSMPKRWTPTPTIHWRASAIFRAIQALRKFMPLSKVSLINTDPSPEEADRSHLSVSRHTIRNRSRVTDQQGAKINQCIYCGMIIGKPQVDHIKPRAKGGTSKINNLVVACARCNARKGNKAPKDIGMTQPQQVTTAQKTRPYQRATSLFLASRLSNEGLEVWWHASIDKPSPSMPTMMHALLTKLVDETTTHSHQFVVKPISNPRKQRFAARTYSLATPPGGRYRRVKNGIKRLIRVNQGLAIGLIAKKRQTLVVPVGAKPPLFMHLIQIGMLCESRRAKHPVRGIVTAVHSSGRLTLSYPEQVFPSGVMWKSTVISPRTFLRIRSTDKIIFLPIRQQEENNGTTHHEAAV